MKKLVKIQLILILLVSITFSCQKNEIDKEDNIEVKIQKVNAYEPINGMTVLGRKLENPYSVENMKKAYQNIINRNSLKSGSISDDSITTTHLYVRFLPKDSGDFNFISSDTSLVLFDYPLDYEIVDYGYYYHDPEIPDSELTWLYTVVKPDYQFPDIQYEILSELCLPPSTSEIDSSSLKSAPAIDWKEIEMEALRITGNYKDTVSTLKAWGASAKQPKGYVKVWDTKTNSYKPVTYVKVVVRWLFRIASDYTDSVGKYEISDYYWFNLSYSVEFQNQQSFQVWGNYAYLKDATHVFARSTTPLGCDCNINTSSQAWMWATMNNAASDYYKYCNDYGITKPPAGLTLWGTQNTNPDWGGSSPMLRRIVFSSEELYNIDFLPGVGELRVQMAGLDLRAYAPDIIIYKQSTTPEVYSTVLHECSHGSHFSQVGQTYWKKYIQHIVENRGYGTGKETNAGYCGVGEMWGGFFGNVCYVKKYGYDDPDYYPAYYWFKSAILYDLWGIATPSEIYKCLTIDVVSHEKLKNKLKEKYTYDSSVDYYFNRYGF
jgi:hypothetical protein